jgi:hypothetical protein
MNFYQHYGQKRINKTNMKFILLGATDRVNYGDNLFAVLIKAYIDKAFNGTARVKNYATLASDLQWYGALPTLPVRELYDDDFAEGARVIVVGGEVLGGNWAVIYQYCNPVFQKIYNTRIGRRIIHQNWVRVWLGGKGELPFVPTPELFRKKVSVVFNAVGGARNEGSAKKIAPMLKKAVYKSFRDQKTHQMLKQAGLDEGVLTPDSAILMSKILSKKRIESEVASQVKEYVEQRSYLYFQIGYFKGGKETVAIAEQLSLILKKTTFDLCLCPIGIAAGHDDHIALEKIYIELDLIGYGDRIDFFARPNMWDTMFLISKSACYMGTSLHGIITAQSFSVPYLLINEKILKAVDYMDCWGVGSAELTMSNLSRFGEKFMELELDHLRVIIKEKTQSQLDMAEINMNEVLGLPCDVKINF